MIFYYEYSYSAAHLKFFDRSPVLIETFFKTPVLIQTFFNTQYNLHKHNLHILFWNPMLEVLFKIRSVKINKFY